MAFSPFDTLINAPTPAVSSNMPSATAPGLSGFAEKADRELTTATDRVNTGPTQGRSGLGGDLATASESVKDAVGGLDRGSQAVVNIQKIHQNQAAMQELMKSLDSYGIDEATKAQMIATIGDGSDATKNAAGMELAKPLILKFASGKRLQKFYNGESFKSAMSGMAESLDEFDKTQKVLEEKAKAEGKDYNPLIAKIAREDLKNEELSKITGELLTGENSDLTPEEQKSVLATIKAMAPPKGRANKEETLRGLGNVLQYLKNYGATAADATIGAIANLDGDQTYTRYFDDKYLSKYGEYVPEDKVEEGLLTEETVKQYTGDTKGRNVIPVQGKDGRVYGIVRLNSDEGIALGTALSSLLNSYIKTQTGAVVTRRAAMAYAEELGLEEFAKFTQLNSEGKLNEDFDPKELIGQVDKAFKVDNRYVNTAAITEAMRKAAVRMNSRVASAYESSATIPKLHEGVKGFKASAQRQLERLNTKVFGNLRLNEIAADAPIRNSAFTQMVGASKPGLEGTIKAIEDVSGDIGKGSKILGKAKGEMKGNEEGTAKTTVAEGYGSGFTLYNFLKKKGETGGDRAVYEELIDANYGTRDNPIYLDEALKTEGIIAPEIRRKMAAKFNAAGQDELAKYLLAGDATVQGLNTLAKKVGLIPETAASDGQPVKMEEKKAERPQAKEDWRVVNQNGKKYKVLYKNGKATNTYKEVK